MKDIKKITKPLRKYIKKIDKRIKKDKCITLMDMLLCDIYHSDNEKFLDELSELMDKYNIGV